ncbi:MAG: ABC transporter substrate-binding protein [Methylocystaceae bacterium]|nr:ABC transporter substrate-binding protein [Methylocystaceae bacterium]
MLKTISKIAVCGALALGTVVSAANAADNYKLGLVTFLSGGAAGPFGVPAKNGADMIIDAINAGTLPAPYNKVGMNGVKIDPVYVDEAGGATKQVSEYRNLVERQGVNAVVGYISSGDCLAVPGVAEEMKKVTVLFDCGTPRVFEEADYKYVFRTASTTTMDSVAAVRYISEKVKGLKSVSGINQNYSFGQDSWNDFSKSLEQLNAGVTVSTTQFPKIYAGQYGAEVSALMVNPSEVIHSSFWGGDMEAFLLQGSARGLFDDQQVLLTCGETALYKFTDNFPEGTIVGGRGPNGIFAPKSDFNDWFQKEFKARFGTEPTYPVYHMVQAILGLKLATEKAAAAEGEIPTDEAVASAFEYLEYDTPAGKVVMANGNGHQAIQEMVFGQVSKVDGELVMKEVVRYPASCVNPPNGVKAEDWIASGFEGAVCN